MCFRYRCMRVATWRSHLNLQEGSCWINSCCTSLDLSCFIVMWSSQILHLITNFYCCLDANWCLKPIIYFSWFISFPFLLFLSSVLWFLNLIFADHADILTGFDLYFLHLLIHSHSLFFESLHLPPTTLLLSYQFKLYLFSCFPEQRSGLEIVKSGMCVFLSKKKKKKKKEGVVLRWKFSSNLPGPKFTKKPTSAPHSLHFPSDVSVFFFFTFALQCLTEKRCCPGSHAEQP